ncbi:MAG: PEP-CTERM sorting domain-containing protein [Lacipirellulaceae bacterium]
MKKILSLTAACAVLLAGGVAQAAFTAAVDLDPAGGTTPGSLNPNFSFGGDTTTASESIPSAAVGLPDHDSLFGGDGATAGDTYVMSYTPGVDADNFFPAAGSLLGSTTGFGTETASGQVGGGSGLYNVYVTFPASTNVNPAGSNFTVTNDGADLVVLAVDQNNGGTGADLDPGPAFVGGANNSWFKLGTVPLTSGTTYTVSMSANANTFVSQRLAGVMWELAIPEPTSLMLLGFAGCALITTRRRTA